MGCSGDKPPGKCLGQNFGLERQHIFQLLPLVIERFLLIYDSFSIHQSVGEILKKPPFSLALKAFPNIMLAITDKEILLIL